MKRKNKIFLPLLLMRIKISFLIISLNRYLNDYNDFSSKNFVSIFNIFNKNIEYEITKDCGKDVNGIQGYKAELKGDSYGLQSFGNKWRCRKKNVFNIGGC
jgi:hypothetical protein